jgi:potassium efflux system protein
LFQTPWKILTLIALVVLVAPGVASSAASHKPSNPAVVLAPAPPTGGLSPSDISASEDVDHASIALQLTYAGLRARVLSDADLKARISEIAPIQAKLAASLAVLTPRLKDFDSRLAQLGPPPGPGQPAEDPATAASRRALTRSRAAIDAEIKQARLLTVEASQLERSLGARLRSNFSARLWARDRSVLDPGLWRDFAAALPSDVGKLRSAITEEMGAFSRASRGRGVTTSLVLAALLAALVAGPVRFLLDRFCRQRFGEGGSSSPFQRAGLAVALVLIAALTPLAAAEILRNAFIARGALTSSFIFLSGLLIRVMVFAAVLEGLGRALLSPARPTWRLAPMSDVAARRLAPYPAIVGVTVGLATFVGGLNTALDTSLPSSIASVCIVVLLELGVVGSALLALGGARFAPAPEDDQSRPRGARAPWVLAAAAAWLALGAALLAVLFGYLALAGFVMRETVWIATVLAIFFLVVHFTDEVFPAALSPFSPMGRAIETAIGLSASAREQIGVLLSGVARLLAILGAWLAIVAPFGANADGLATRLAGANVVFHLGAVTVSPAAIAGALGLFLVGLLVTRAVRGWLDKHYLPKTRLDVGLRTSVGAGITYLGALIALLIGFASLGLSFSQIALFASALSVGIGFGLQAIIGNFVSGLILLAERPVQVGDWIAIGDLEGDVRRISIRATEIEMRDRSKLIVPNSDLVTKTVRNVTHGGAMGRVKIVLKVNDTADPAKVRDVLMGPIRAHADVLPDPAAAAYLTDVSNGAMEFTIFAYVASPREVFHVKSELLFQIVPELAGRGIDLANSTPIVNVGMDRPIEPAPAPPAAGKS